MCHLLSSHIKEFNIRQAVLDPTAEERDIMSFPLKVLRAVSTNVLLMYSSLGIFICFLALCVALAVKRNLLAGKAPDLLGKG